MGSSSSLKLVFFLIDSISSHLLQKFASFHSTSSVFYHLPRAFPSAKRVLISLLSLFASQCAISLIPFAAICFAAQFPISLLPFYLKLTLISFSCNPPLKPTSALLLITPRANLHLTWSQHLIQMITLTSWIQVDQWSFKHIIVLVFPLLCWLILLILLCWSPKMLIDRVH